jgi:glycosyltransferase involved in cell wall biosynthesis
MLLAILALPILGLINSWIYTGAQIVIVAVAFFSGLDLFMLGIMGQYLGRNYIESKNRPPYLIEEVIGGGEEDNG